MGEALAGAVATGGGKGAGVAGSVGVLGVPGAVVTGGVVGCGSVFFMFDPALQAHFCALQPQALSAVPGGWGRLGATRCELTQVTTATFITALTAAHARANAPKAKTRKRPAK